jgi:hypothetical protein
MAIGSAPEIGTKFRKGLWTREEANAWRAEIGDDGVGGYATLAYADRQKYAVSEFPLVPYISQ